MGRALVGHLLAARHDIRLYNRTPGHAAELVASGAALATTPERMPSEMPTSCSRCCSGPPSYAR
ncbi:NAD(P)-binding domain-containing protein [Microbacterium invictum]|uniref:NAD(P)-binding domain-containing protein n=1 Tax=Microbacterium invictum TaxID=515415 RepID=UPI003A101811